MHGIQLMTAAALITATCIVSLSATGQESDNTQSLQTCLNDSTSSHKSCNIGSNRDTTIPPLFITTDASQDHLVECKDFKHQEDGSWANIVPIWVNKSSVKGTIYFRQGMILNNMDFAQILNHTCQH
jgi:hypothetical protein